MKYTIDPWVFEQIPEICFGIIIGKGLKNSSTTEKDSELLKNAEDQIQAQISPLELKSHPRVAIYREALKRVDINPNKYMNSVEAMSKRVVNSGALPRINALVDLCNAVALKEIVSLGAHDLKDIDADLEVRRSVEGDLFRPFGSVDFEDVPLGELVFTSGPKIQTRQWLWRQSELGKITVDSSDIVFQIVGFKGDYFENFKRSLSAIEALVEERFSGASETFIVDAHQNMIEFDI